MGLRMRLLSLVLFLGVAVLSDNLLIAQSTPVPLPPPQTGVRNHYLTVSETPRPLPSPKMPLPAPPPPLVQDRSPIVALQPPSPPLALVISPAVREPLRPVPIPRVETVSERVFAPRVSPMAWTFDQVISAMLTSDPRLRIGQEDIRQAQAELWTSSLLPNPEFTAEGGALPFRRVGRGEYEGTPEMNFHVEFPVDWFLFAKRQAEMNSARWEVRQAHAEYADLIRERIVETATLFFDVLEAKALVEVAQQDVDLMAELEERVRSGVAAGGVPAVEWKRISLELMQCRQELLETETALDILKAQLRSQFGRTDYDPHFDITGDLDAPPILNAMPLEEAFAMARQNRPDIRALRMGVGRARADVHLENRNARPEVTAFAGVGREYASFEDIEAGNYNNWGIGLTVSIPLFDRNQGNRMAARSALTQSNREYQLGIVELRAEIVEADRELRTAHRRANIFATEEVRLAREVRDIMIEGWRAGGTPLIDVLDAERSYRETMRLFITSRADYWRAFYTYNSVVGVDSVNALRVPTW